MMSLHRASPRQQRGLSLIELMLAASLGLVLMLGIGSLFSSGKQSFRLQDNLSRMQDNARFALDTLAHYIRQAGDLGCNHQATINRQVASIGDFHPSLRGYEHSNLPTTIYGNNELRPGDIAPQTDSLTISRMNSPQLPIIDSDGQYIRTQAHGFGDDIRRGRLLMISDCEQADIFAVSDADAALGLIEHAGLSKAYNDQARIAQLDYSTFYIRHTHGHYALMRRYLSIHGNQWQVRSETIAEGIQDMQILYGEDLDGNGERIRYVDANQANPARISAVRIHLLLRSSEAGLSAQPHSFWFNGELHVASDRYLYRTYSKTIHLRNRGLSS